MRKLMWFTIGFCISCALCAYGLPSEWIVPGMLLSCLLVGASCWKQLRIPAFTGLGVVLGLVWFALFQRFYLLPAVSLDGLTVDACVTATDYSYQTDYGSAVDGEIQLDGKPYQIRLYINDFQEIQPGDTISGQFKMRYTARGGQQDETYHSGKGILLLGYQRGEVQFMKEAQGADEYYASELAYEIKSILRGLFPEEIYSFAQALLLGDTSELDYETDTALKISGIRHIVAVSGLHVTLLYSLINTLTLRKRFLTALLSLPVLAVFAAVAGFTPSVTRACIMVSLMILAQVFEKEYDPPTALAFSSLVMLVANPIVITAVGFQLTVGCVAGIQLFGSRISDWLKVKLGNPKGKGLAAKMKRGFISSVSVTLSAMSLTTPLSACYFGTVSLVGILTNLITLWIVNIVFNALVALCACSLISSGFASALAQVINWLIRMVLRLSGWLASVPLAAVYTVSPYIVIWLFFVYTLLAAFLMSSRKRPVTLLCFGVIGLCIALAASWAEPLMDDTRMTVLDVGQGQSIILQSEGRTYLVDCGGSSDDTAADLAAQTLLSQGISRLDGIILTHADQDHAGGIMSLLSRVRTDQLLIPATADADTAAQLEQAARGEVITVAEDLQITFGGVQITVFGPLFVENSNENSLCVLFDTKTCDILITGDRGALGEMMLLREHDLPDVDVLIAGHHGSKYSTTEELLVQTKPEVVIISAGKDNAYGHPARETLDRLTKYGCQIMRTDIHGTIIIRR